MNHQNYRFLHISQHWGSKKGILKDGSTIFYNPVTDEGKRSLTSLKDLQLLIEFHNWSDNGVYYSFSNKEDASWGQEVYEIKNDGSLVFAKANYDTSD